MEPLGGERFANVVQLEAKLLGCVEEYYILMARIGQAITFADDILRFHEPVPRTSEKLIQILEVRITGRLLLWMYHIPGRVGIVIYYRAASHANFPRPATDLFRRLNHTVGLVVLAFETPYVTKLDVDDGP